METYSLSDLITPFLLLLYLLSLFFCILLSFVVLLKNRKSVTHVVFFILGISLSLWLTASFLQGLSYLHPYVLTIHRIGIVFAMPLSASFFMLAWVFPYHHLSIPKKIAYTVAIVTLVIMALNASPYAFTALKPGTTIPVVGVGLIPFAIVSTFFSVGTIFILAHKLWKTKGQEKKQLLLFVFGILIILSLIIATILVPVMFFGSLLFVPLTPLYVLIFLCITAYAILRYQLFNIKLIIAQALTGLISLVLFAKIFSNTSYGAEAVDIFIFLIFSMLSIFVVRNVRKEIRQREEIEELAKKLEKANERLKALDKMKSEFVSIASHQLRSPLTSIRGYSSMLLEGSFGKLPKNARMAVERIDESSRFMATSVEDYLNVSRIQAGNMKYEYSDFNLRDLAERVADDTRQLAVKKGLLLMFKSDMDKKGIVHADIGKTRQVIDNLINNALKYTPKGSITIFVHDNVRKKQIYVDVIDTGIGMSEFTRDNMFEKFERASNANEVNVTGTGLGLYIARKMAREMGGDVIAYSDGEGEGSTFRIEMPLQM